MERWGERKENEKKLWRWGSVAFKIFHVVTLSPTTKIFVLENELTKKEIRV